MRNSFAACFVAFHVLIPSLVVAAQVTPLPQWKLANFSTAQMAAGMSDDSSDANHDGAVNLLAYASGLTPFQPADSLLPTASILSGRLQLSFL